MKKLILLDAYALIYRAYYALIRSPRINSKRMNTSAIFGFVNTLEEVLKRENPDFIGVAFDPKGGTFRHEIYPAYKAQREETPEDIRVAVPYIKKILEAYRIPVLEIPGFEADDVIGTLATQASQQGDIMTYMMTPDKDYGQLVKDNVKMMRPRHGSNDFDVLGPQEVCEKYGIQSPLQVIDLLGLMGDASDNVPGCPGVGEKTAVKLIGDFGGIEQLIERSSELKGALRQKVEDNVEGIRFSKLLVTIKTDVPITLDLDLLSRKPVDMERLRPLFEELEFRSLLQRVTGGAVSTPTPTKPQKQPIPSSGQLDLFATYEPQEANKPNEANEPANGDFGSLFAASSLATLADTPHSYHLVNTDESMEQLVKTLTDADIVCFDTETTSTEPMLAELVGLSFAVKEGEAYYVPVPADKTSAQHIVDQLKPILENPSTLKVGQNMKYDIIVLANYGVRVQGKMFDTMIAHYILKPEMHHNMDLLAEVYLNYQTIHIDELIGPKGKNQKSMRSLPPSQVYEYAAEDADVTLRLKNKLEPELKKFECEKLFYEIEMPLMPVLAEMEMNGVCLDTDSLQETSKVLTDRMNELERRIYELAGLQFNIASPKQVGEILFDKLKIIEKPKKTKTGQYVTSEDVLQQLRNKHEIVADILEHRGLKKLIGTYIEALPKLINPRTGHIHTSFNQTITATGRLSSSDPNLQNIPIRGEDGKEIRKAFIPEPGCLFFSADYSQIELRVMAHLSQDPQMIEVFREGKDLHAATAANIYKKPIEEVTRDERTKSKRANFGIIYGITVFGLAERLDIPRDEAKMLIDGYFATFPQVHDYMEKSKEVARQKGYVTTLFGRRRYLPDINSHNATVRGFAERNAINAPIQGTAADIIKVAMIHIHERFKKEGIKSKMILQVHDELNFSVYPEEKEQVERIVIEEMQAAFPLIVPLVADSGFGQNWLEAH